MEILNELYYKSVAENKQNLYFWENYLQNLKALDFNAYNEKLKVPILVPIGSRLLFRGELKHTNEVTVALGADYFVKCSLKQADILRQHRIKVAQEKVNAYNKEKGYLEKQMSFTQQNIYDNQGKEIIEFHTEEEEKVWRLKHMQNVKEYMQKKAKENHNCKDDITDEELWERLEELELQEELENELNTISEDNSSLSRLSESNLEPFVVKEDFRDTKGNIVHVEKDEIKSEKELKNKNIIDQEGEAPGNLSKLDLLQKIIDRQNELDEKLLELKNRKRSQSKTEIDLKSRLDELEQLDDLEDEMDRLDDIIENENVEESDEELSKSDTTNLQRRVSFIDEDDSETLNLTFTHSEVEPDNGPYDPDKGIQKPSDIYKAYPNLFSSEVTSILKKSKYASDVDIVDVVAKKPVINDAKETRKQMQPQQPVSEKYEDVAPKTIVLKDIVEKMVPDNNKLEAEKKPMSLFKKKRLQIKS